jgi:hypothetical protein
MQIHKLVLNFAAALVVAAITTNGAEARHYRHLEAYNDYPISAASCAPPPPTAMYIYPAANWEPFFRHHVYRYGPILVCDPSIATTNVISVRF